MNTTTTAFKEGKLPTKEINLSPKDIARFWKKVRIGDGCWEWDSVLCEWGYGQFSIRVNKKGRLFRAHRVAYTIEYGPIPEGLSVCHRCDNPKCVRPDHLFVGTSHDNNADKIAKGRGPRTKLTPEAVIAIKALCNVEGALAVARKFQISPRTVGEIWDGVYWKHVGGTCPPRIKRSNAPSAAYDRDDVLRRWKAGESYSSIGRSVGRDHATIKCLVRRMLKVENA